MDPEGGFDPFYAGLLTPQTPLYMNQTPSTDMHETTEVAQNLRKRRLEQSGPGLRIEKSVSPSPFLTPVQGAQPFTGSDTGMFGVSESAAASSSSALLTSPPRVGPATSTSRRGRGFLGSDSDSDDGNNQVASPTPSFFGSMPPPPPDLYPDLSTSNHPMGNFVSPLGIPSLPGASSDTFGLHQMMPSIFTGPPRKVRVNNQDSYSNAAANQPSTAPFAQMIPGVNPLQLNSSMFTRPPATRPSKAPTVPAPAAGAPHPAASVVSPAPIPSVHRPANPPARPNLFQSAASVNLQQVNRVQPGAQAVGMGQSQGGHSAAAAATTGRLPRPVRPGQFNSDPLLMQERLTPSTSSTFAPAGMGTHHMLTEPTAKQKGKSKKKPAELTIDAPQIRAEIGFSQKPPFDEDDPVMYLGVDPERYKASVTSDGRYVPMVAVDPKTGLARFNEPTIHHDIILQDEPWNMWFGYQRWRVLGRSDVFAKEQPTTLTADMKSIQRQEAIAQHKILCQMYAEIEIGEMVPGKELESSTFVRDYFMALPVAYSSQYRAHLVDPLDVQRIENALFQFARFILDNFPPETHHRIKEKLSRIPYDDPAMNLRRLMRRRIMQVHNVAVTVLQELFREALDKYIEDGRGVDVLIKTFGAEKFQTFNAHGPVQFLKDHGEESAHIAKTFLAQSLVAIETPKFVRMAMAVSTVEMLSYLLYYSSISVYHYRAQNGVESPFVMVQGCLARIRATHVALAATASGQPFTLFPGRRSEGVTTQIRPTIALLELAGSGHLSGSSGYLSTKLKSATSHAREPVNTAQGEYHVTIAGYMTPTQEMQKQLSDEFEASLYKPEEERQTDEAGMRARFWWKFHSGYEPDMRQFSGLPAPSSNDEGEHPEQDAGSSLTDEQMQVDREQQVLRDIEEREQRDRLRVEREQRQRRVQAEARRDAVHDGNAASFESLAEQRATSLASASATRAPAANNDDDGVEIIEPDDADLLTKWKALAASRKRTLDKLSSELQEASRLYSLNRDDDNLRAARESKKNKVDEADTQHKNALEKVERLTRKMATSSRPGASQQESSGEPPMKTEGGVKTEMNSLRDKVEQQSQYVAELQRRLRAAESSNTSAEIMHTGEREGAQEDLRRMRDTLAKRDMELQAAQQAANEAAQRIADLDAATQQAIAERQALQDRLDEHNRRHSDQPEVANALMSNIQALDQRLQQRRAQTEAAERERDAASSRVATATHKRTRLKQNMSKVAADAADPSSSSAAAAAASSVPPRTGLFDRQIHPPRRLRD